MRLLQALKTLYKRNMFSHIPFAYVSFTNANPPYPYLTSFLIKSHAAFSNVPLILYTHDIDDIHEYLDCSDISLIVVKLEESVHFESAYFYKSYVIHDVLSKGLHAGYYVESDDILIPGCDTRIQRWLPSLKDLPLCPIHQNTVILPSDYLRQFGVDYQTQPYVHGHVLFHANHIAFIKEWHEESKRVHGANWDESVLNVLLWKHGAKNYYLPVIDPWWSTDDYKDVNDTVFRDTGIVTYHGFKRLDEASRIYSFMIEHASKILDQRVSEPV